MRARRDHRDQYVSLEREVVEEIKKEHARSPKYTYDGKSAAQVMQEHDVEILDLDGTYLPPSPGRERLLKASRRLTAEEFVTEYFQEHGSSVIRTESTPFHALVAVLAWRLIQDPSDPKLQVSPVGDRTTFEDVGVSATQMLVPLPEDFGKPGYGTRRGTEIEQYVESLPGTTNELLRLFDASIEGSRGLREYLWAHRPEHVARAREVVEVIPADAIRRILKALTEDYWARYVGWPDLVVYQPNQYFLAEVKASGDKLNDDQKAWIELNRLVLRLPFKVVKIHRRATVKDGTPTLRGR